MDTETLIRIDPSKLLREVPEDGTLLALVRTVEGRYKEDKEGYVTIPLGNRENWTKIPMFFKEINTKDLLKFNLRNLGLTEPKYYVMVNSMFDEDTVTSIDLAGTTSASELEGQMMLYEGPKGNLLATSRLNQMVAGLMEGRVNINISAIPTYWFYVLDMFKMAEKPTDTELGNALNGYIANLSEARRKKKEKLLQEKAEQKTETPINEQYVPVNDILFELTGTPGERIYNGVQMTPERVAKEETFLSALNNISLIKPSMGYKIAAFYIAALFNPGTCHLTLKNATALQFLREKYGSIVESNLIGNVKSDVTDFITAFKRGIHLGMKTLMIEERKNRYLVKASDRFVFTYYSASALPYFYFKDLYSCPYVVTAMDREAVIRNNNLYGVANSYSDIFKCGLRNIEQVHQIIWEFSNGYLHNFPWGDNRFLCGSIIAASLPKNPLLEIYRGDTNTFKDSLDHFYGDADIDIAVKLKEDSDSEQRNQEFLNEFTEILEHLTKVVGASPAVTKETSLKYKIQFPNTRPFQIFALPTIITNRNKIYEATKAGTSIPEKEYPATSLDAMLTFVGSFHLGQVRAFYDGKEFYMLTSAVLTYMTRISPTYHFTLHPEKLCKIIRKYDIRGFGVMLKNSDKDVVKYSYQQDANSTIFTIHRGVVQLRSKIAKVTGRTVPYTINGERTEQFGTATIYPWSRRYLVGFTPKQRHNHNQLYTESDWKLHKNATFHALLDAIYAYASEPQAFTQNLVDRQDKYFRLQDFRYPTDTSKVFEKYVIKGDSSEADEIMQKIENHLNTSTTNDIYDIDIPEDKETPKENTNRTFEKDVSMEEVTEQLDSFFWE